MQVIVLVAGFPLPCSSRLTRQGESMRKDDLMNADLFSEILLLGSGVAIAVTLVMVIVAAVTSAAALLQ